MSVLCEKLLQELTKQDCIYRDLVKESDGFVLPVMDEDELVCVSLMDEIENYIKLNNTLRNLIEMKRKGE